MPTSEQVDEAVQKRKVRGTPRWEHVTSSNGFHQWLARLGDPFADAYVESVPDPNAMDGLITPDGVVSAKLRNLAPDAVARYEDAQRKALDTLVNAVTGIDPAPVLCGLILLTRVESWGSYFEPASPPTYLDVELVAGIVSSSSYDDRRPATAQDLLAVASAVEEVRWWAHAVATAHHFARESDTAKRVRDDLLTRWLALRGGAYPVHAVATAEALVSGQENNLRTRLGFGYTDLADFVVALKYRQEVATKSAINTAWEHAVSVTTEQPDRLADGSRRFQMAWLDTVMHLLPGMWGIALDGGPHLLGAGHGRTEPAILEALGLSTGSSKPVKSVLVDPPHRVRPFALLPPQLDREGNEIGPPITLPVNLPALTTDLHLTVEALLARTFPKWPAMRARAVDSHAVELLQRALPGSRAVTNVFIDGVNGREEVDGVVLYEDVAIVIEGKGAPLKLAALRGSVDKLVGQLRELVTDGTRQLDRDRAYVLQGNPAKFYDVSGRCVLEIDSTKIRRCYQMLACLDGLSDVGTRLPRLTELGLLDETAKPWIVGITDLHVVVDILDKPAELIGYLEFRERWIRESQLVIIDELELLAMYVYQVDLSAKLAQVPEGGIAVLTPSQSIFDAWYDGLAGHGPAVTKPRIKTTPRLRRFVDELQRTKPSGWLAATTAALQVPITVATVLDMTETGLARRVRTHGISISNDPEHRIVVVTKGRDYPDPEDVSALVAGSRRQAVWLFLRQDGGRLRLENVTLT